MTSLGHPYDELPQYRCEKLREVGEQKTKKKVVKAKRKSCIILYVIFFAE